MHLSKNHTHTHTLCIPYAINCNFMYYLTCTLCFFQAKANHHFLLLFYARFQIKYAETSALSNTNIEESLCQCVKQVIHQLDNPSLIGSLREKLHAKGRLSSTDSRSSGRMSSGEKKSLGTLAEKVEEKAAPAAVAAASAAAASGAGPKKAKDGSSSSSSKEKDCVIS